MSEIGIKDQCFGVEVEMTGITRKQAAQALAAYFGTEPRHGSDHYDSWYVTDTDGKEWRLMYDPYTILFNLSGDTPELCKEKNRLQFRKSGYSLKVAHNMLLLFTWPILKQFTPEKVKDLISYYRVHNKPMIELENGWYHIEILGGETLQDGDYEPTFEFLIQPAANEEATINADMNCSFEITSSAY